MIALKLNLDGTTERVDLNSGGRQTLSGLQNEIDCRTVDVVSIGLEGDNAVDMWIDDEGAICMKPESINYVANAILAKLGVQINGVICGVVLFAESNDEGETIGLETEVMERLEEVAEDIRGDELFGLWQRRVDREQQEQHDKAARDYREWQQKNGFGFTPEAAERTDSARWVAEHEEGSQ